MEYLVTRDENHDELEHYGVLGMKWGHRRARINMEKSKKARAAGNIKAANKYEAKSKKIKAKHMTRVGGKKSYDYSANEHVGKSIVKSMIFGTYGTLKYNEAKSKGASTGQAAVEGALYAIGNSLTYGVASIVEPRLRKPTSK